MEMRYEMVIRHQTLDWETSGKRLGNFILSQKRFRIKRVKIMRKQLKMFTSSKINKI